MPTIDEAAVSPPARRAERRRHCVLALAVAVVVAAASLGGAGAAAPPGTVVSRFAAFGVPLVCGGPRGRYVALTFDDGPGPYSARIVRALRRAHARATFFLVGRQVALWPGAAALERHSGALGDHTWGHARLTGLDADAVAAQLVSTKRAIERQTHAPVQLFRPPYGAHDRTVDDAARSLGLLQVLWSVDARDFEGIPWYEIAANVERALRPGSIVLMHEIHGETVRALESGILPYLRAHGFRAVSIPELLTVDPPGRGQLAAGLAGCLRSAG